jgi:hypothetical protein
MADIDVERKSSMAWLWWLLGLLVLALLAWLLLRGGDDPEVAAVEPLPAPAPVTPATTPEPIAQGPLCVAQALSGATPNIGQTLGTCSMNVVEVVSDRGFWIEENGERVFVVINEGAPGVADTQGAAERPDINPGQTITVSEAMVRDDVQNVAGPLDEQTRTLAGQQPWFLTVEEENVQILTTGEPQPGTDPATVP